LNRVNAKRESNYSERRKNLCRQPQILNQGMVAEKR